ncbi:MAG: hypothetical protein KJ601_00405, partial [Nanoarchaeota archaeon]|nr:hypothetical protein [Nanoarchaeota archaeon]
MEKLYLRKSRSQNKGQLSLFMIVGVVLLLGLGLIYYINSKAVEEAKPVEFDLYISENVQAFVENCLSQIAVQGLDILGLQGGRIYLYEPYFEYNNYKTNLLYYYGRNLVPSLDEMEIELENYVKYNLRSCTQDFQVFKGLTITYGTLDTNAYIGKASVLFDVNWPLEIKQSNIRKELSAFKSTIHIDLEKFWNASKIIVNSTMEQPDIIDVLQLMYLDLNAVYFVNEENNMMYFLSDNRSEVYGRPYYYIFGMQFNNSAQISEPAAPILLNIQDLTAFEGIQFNYTVRAFDPNGDKVIYSSVTDLFDIEPETGRFSFTPDNFDLGMHLVVVTATDETGLEAVNFFDINITKQNYPPAISRILNQTAYVNMTFNMTINATDPEGDQLYYLDNSTLFDVHPLTGLIRFKPINST